MSKMKQLKQENQSLKEELIELKYVLRGLNILN